jgi:hypothetical protein
MPEAGIGAAEADEALLVKGKDCLTAVLVGECWRLWSACLLAAAAEKSRRRTLSTRVCAWFAGRGGLLALRALSAAAAADSHALADCSSDQACAAVLAATAPPAPAPAPDAGLSTAGAGTPTEALRAVGLLRYVGADVDLGFAGAVAATEPAEGAEGALRTAVAERGLGLTTAAAGAGAGAGAVAWEWAGGALELVTRRAARF